MPGDRIRSGWSKRITIAVQVDSRPAVVLDTHRGYWDFFNVWTRGDAQGVDFTIDYGVYD